MGTQNLDYEGYVLTVHTEQNSRGAWGASITVLQNGASVAVLDGDDMQPEWLTDAEAQRDGIDRGRAFVDRRKRGGGQ